jgi:hypothetical protein
MIQNYFGAEGDAFPVGRPASYPPCVLPFRMLGVTWKGDVPLCRGAAYQTGSSEGLMIGNIHTGTLAELWRGPVIERYRDGHRQRRAELMPLCKNCPDSQAPFWRKRYDNNPHLADPRESFIPVASLTSRTARR